MSDKFTVDQAAAVEHTLGTDGYQILVEYLKANGAAATNALTRQGTDWERTNYLRGKLAGIELLFPENVRKQKYPT